MAARLDSVRHKILMFVATALTTGIDFSHRDSTQREGDGQDVVFVIGNSKKAEERQEITLSKHIMASRSPYFRELVQNLESGKVKYSTGA